MPELPEVETVAEDLRKALLVGLTFNDVKILWNRSIAIPSATDFTKRIKGQKIVKIARRGKYLLLHLSEDVLLVHLRMTGKLLLKNDKVPHSSYERVIFYLNDGRQLRFEDTRKFGKCYLVSQAADVIGKLGPEPLETNFPDEQWVKALKSKKRLIKPLLLDQSFIAGLGNIYVDEALWEAKIHPKRLSNTLSSHESSALSKAIVNVLNKGISSQGTTLGRGKTNFYRLDGKPGKNASQMHVFRKTGLPCPRCKTLIKRIVVGQRSTHYCPGCQKEQKSVK